MFRSKNNKSLSQSDNMDDTRTEGVSAAGMEQAEGLPGHDGVDCPPWEETSQDGHKTSTLREYLLSILSGSILSRSEVRRAYPYMILLTVLAFLYIGNVFRSQYLYREQIRLTEEIKELRSRSMTIASQRMIATRQSRIIEDINSRGLPLRESLQPNKIIPRDTDDSQ